MDSDEQIFRDALEVLRRDGWCQGVYHYPSGTGHCALGGLDVAMGHPLKNFETGGDLEAFDRTALPLDAVAESLFPTRIDPDSPKALVAQVNDHPDTTFEDIEVIFEKTAIRASEIV